MGICYDSDPVLVSLQLTNFQSPIGLRMNHIVFREDPKSQISVSSTFTFSKYTTRHLPMGAGHCPWGGYTDRNVCNIHEDVRLASRRRTMLQPETFSKFGTLPAKLAPCQYFRIVLEEIPHSPTTFGKMPKIVGTLPKIPHLTLAGAN